MNKLMARIVAIVMAVMMLGTVSFAANLNEANNEIPADASADSYSDVWTVKATAENGTIVAMYQDDEKPGAIAIDPAKLGDSKYVTVEYSGKGATSKSTVTVGVNKKSTGSVSVGNTVTLGSGENEKTYTDVAFVENTFSVDGKFIKKLGYILKDLNATGNPNEFAYENTSFSGEGNINFSVLIYGVPTTANIVAEQFIEYVEN